MAEAVPLGAAGAGDELAAGRAEYVGLTGLAAADVVGDTPAPVLLSFLRLLALADARAAVLVPAPALAADVDTAKGVEPQLLLALFPGLR
jgi:hypothetical protein